MPPIVPVAIGAATAATSIAGTIAQNKKAKQAASAQHAISAAHQAHIEQAMQMQLEQVGQQMAVEKLKMQNDAHQMRGRIRVSSAGRGVGTGSTQMAIMRQAHFDELANMALMEQNHHNAVLAIQSDAHAAKLNLAQNLTANLATISNMKSNPLLAGISGAIGGVNTGLQIHKAMKS